MRSVGSGLVVAILVIAGCSSSNTSKQGLGGTLDATFGGGGFVTWDSGRHDEARALLVDGQGRTTIVGNTESPRGDDNMIAIRFMPDGSLDETFGTKGVFQFDRLDGGGDSLGGNDRGYSITEGPNGRVIIGGFSVNEAGDREMAIWVLNPGGSLDSGFAFGRGWTTVGGTTGAGSSDQAFDILTDATGAIVAAGRSDNATNDGDLVVWRIKPNGELDTSFNGTGFVIWSRGGQDNAYANALDHAGNILVTGKSSSGATGAPDDMVWLTISPTGQITGETIYDASSGINPGEPWVIGRDITVDANGARVIVGWSADASGGLKGQTFIWKYVTDGQLEENFGSFGGIEVYQETDHNNGRGVTTDADKRILICGFIRMNGDANLAVWRYEGDGELDPTFNGGVAVFDSGNGEDQGNGVAINSTNGNVMVAGIVPSSSGDGDIAVWSYFSS